MKILYHHRLGSKDGQFVHVSEVVNALEHQGHEVLLVQPRSLQRNSFGQTTPWVAALKKRVPQFIYELMEFNYTFVSLIKIVIAARRFKPDFIYERFSLYMVGGVWAKRLLGIPLLLEINAPLFEERSSDLTVALKRFAKWSQYYTFKHADRLLPVTRVMAKTVHAYEVPESKIEVIHNGINLEHFKVSQSKAELKSALGLDGQTTIGFVGFLRGWHKLEFLLEAFAELSESSNTTLLIIGGGPGRASMEQKAKELGIKDRVRITGLASREEIPSLTGALDVAILPNVVPYSSPLKLFEYLQMRCAVVAPDSENIREVLTHEQDALLFPLSDKSAMIAAVARLLEDDQLRLKLADNGARLIMEKGYTWHHNAERITGMARMLLDAR